MKKFIKEAILFLLCTFTICIGVELYLLTVSNEYSYKRWYVENRGDEIKTLFLGHSHVGNGIIPNCIDDSVFNMATQGRNVYYDAIIAERYISTLKNLECVVWPLGYNFQYLSYKYPCTKKQGTDTDISSSYRCMFTKYMDISYEDEFHYLYWSELMNSNLDYAKRILGGDFETIHQCDSTGFEKIAIKDKRPTWKVDALPKIVDYEHPNAQKSFEHSLSYMKRIAKACREAGVRLVVITCPCYTTFLDLMTPRGNEDMQACVDSMKSVYPAMEYYNYIADDRFVEDDFSNSSHLTDVGAKKFSIILRDEVLSKH